MYANSLILNGGEVEALTAGHPIGQAPGEKSVKVPIVFADFQVAEFVRDYVIDASGGKTN